MAFIIFKYRQKGRRHMIEWSINLESGNLNIDEQHKKLLEIMNNIGYILENKNFEFEHLLQVVTELLQVRG